MTITLPLSSVLAAHVAGLPDDAVPDAALHAARRCLLDGLGVMLAASGSSDDVQPFVAMAREGGAGPAAVLGTNFRATPALAALANGAMAHALDFEDAFDPAPCHPNASLLPAVLAVADGDPTVTGRALLAAIAIGCDLVCRLGLSLERPMEEGGWYPPPILGAMGAVAAAARLRGANARQLLDAFSLMLGQVSCPGEIKYSPETVIRAVREAFPAQAAVQASALAMAGVRGFDAPFEGQGGFYRLFSTGGYREDAVIETLGRSFWIEQLTFKRWPACRGTHAYIQAAQALRSEQALRPEMIAKVVAVGGEAQRMLAEPLAAKQAPASAIEAKFSIPYTVASALFDADVTLESFDPRARCDPARLSLAARTSFVERPGWGRHRAAAGLLLIDLEDGRRIEREVEQPLGDPAQPLGDAALQAKFVDCAARAQMPVGEAAARSLASAIWHLDEAPSASAALSLDRYVT